LRTEAKVTEEKLLDYCAARLVGHKRPIANFTWERPAIECRGESGIRPAPHPHWAITRIAPTEEDACN
jgi:hypothetical protein